MRARSQDLKVNTLSSALSGVCFDLVITGSIAAVESVKFIRALRRLGATVRPWLSTSARRFITADAVSWAAGGEPVMTELSGAAPHIAASDALLVIPSTFHFASAMAAGNASTPTLTLAASYLGATKPIFLLPAVDLSLSLHPQWPKIKADLSDRVGWLPSRMDEGKLKFPEPEVLAEEVSHAYLSLRRLGDLPIVLSMGGTRAPIDEVRWIGNQSRGKLGSALAEEFYRHGFKTHVVAAEAQILPRTATSLTRVQTNAEMECALRQAFSEQNAHAIFAAAVSDYGAENVFSGKIPSNSENLLLNLKRQKKLIGEFTPFGKKIGFKLLYSSFPSEREKIALEYMQRYALAGIVVNDLKEIREDSHPTYFFNEKEPFKTATSHSELAANLMAFLSSDGGKNANF